jgi:hypothetical protein
MYVGPGLIKHPQAGETIAVNVVYCGDPAAGEKELAPLRKIGKPVVDNVTAQDHMVIQTMRDATMHHGIRSYAKNGMIKAWSQPLVNAMLDAYDPRVVMNSHVTGGAVRQVGELDTAFPHRNTELMLGVVAYWEDPARDEEIVGAARAVYGALEPHTGGYYDNISFEPSEAARNYGPAYSRLSRIKREFDPGNFFRLNSNIKPA